VIDNCAKPPQGAGRAHWPGRAPGRPGTPQAGREVQRPAGAEAGGLAIAQALAVGPREGRSAAIRAPWPSIRHPRSPPSWPRRLTKGRRPHPGDICDLTQDRRWSHV